MATDYPQKILITTSPNMPKFYAGMKGAHTTHGMRGTRFYRIFVNVKTRCGNPNATKFHLWGGKGVKCLWDSFEYFRDDMYESYLAHVAEHGEKNTSIDRVDINGHYEKENCRWATPKKQARNTTQNKLISFRGENKTIGAWSEEFGISTQQIRKRLSWGWSLEEALTTKKYASVTRR